MSNVRVLSVMAIGFATACSGDKGKVSLSVAGSSQSAALSATPGSDGLSLSDGTSSLVITSAEVVLKEIEIEGTEGAGCDSEENDDSCGEIETSALIVSLPLDGSASQEIGVDVPAGTYEEIDFKVHKLEDDEIDESSSLADQSIRVVGTWNGTEFTYVSDLEAEKELKLDPPLTVDDAASMNVTLNVDIASWFVDAGGLLVDPSTGLHDGENEELIRDNIEGSFEGFEDHDGDGHDDDQEDEHD